MGVVWLVADSPKVLCNHLYCTLLVRNICHTTKRFVCLYLAQKYPEILVLHLYLRLYTHESTWCFGSAHCLLVPVIPLNTLLHSSLPSLPLNMNFTENSLKNCNMRPLGLLSTNAIQQDMQCYSWCDVLISIRPHSRKCIICCTSYSCLCVCLSLRKCAKTKKCH